MENLSECLAEHAYLWSGEGRERYCLVGAVGADATGLDQCQIVDSARLRLLSIGDEQLAAKIKRHMYASGAKCITPSEFATLCRGRSDAS